MDILIGDRCIDAYYGASFDEQRLGLDVEASNGETVPLVYSREGGCYDQILWALRTVFD